MITLAKRIEIAKRMTKASSEIKEWRLRRKKDKDLKKLAVKVAADKGYIIATATELHEKYPTLFSFNGFDDGKKMIWAIGRGCGLDVLTFIPI